jgi:hypothetical protein
VNVKADVDPKVELNIAAVGGNGCFLFETPFSDTLSNLRENGMLSPYPTHD